MPPRANFRFFAGHPLHWLSLGFGAGLMPVAPGTWGSLVAVPLYFLIADWPAVFYLLFVAGLFAAGAFAAGFTTRELGVHDHKAIVVDEIIGVLTALFQCPPDWHWVVLAFLLFRALDVLKPWPVWVVDRHVHSGLGIVLDDFLAGLYTFIAVQILIFLT